MSKKSSSRNWILCILLSIAAFSSCNNETVFFQYTNTPEEGWEKNDTLSFNIPPLKEGGKYSTTLGLRINDRFPFAKLYLVLDQEIISRNDHDSIVKTVFTQDTVCCQITNTQGRHLGQGVTYFQYKQDVSINDLQQNDSLRVTVRHCMKRHILPGISNIGIKLKRTPN